MARHVAHQQHVAAAAAHLRAAQRELSELYQQTEEKELSVEGDASPGQADWHAAFLCLQREHAALKMQYESDMRKWINFKRWWKRSVLAKRQRKQKLRASAASEAGLTSAPADAPRPDCSVQSPLKSREQIMEHRKRVRDMMQKNPLLFKGLGRYATPTKYVKLLMCRAVLDEDKSTKSHHAPDCPCCEAVCHPHSRSTILLLAKTSTSLGPL